MTPRQGLWMLGLVAACVIASPSRAQTPDESKSNVTFDTIDDVKIAGTFYRGPKGIDSPTAILIHRFNSDRSKGGWDALARELQTKLNFSVLTFDLRGHGQSTTVRDRFWDFQHNKLGLRGGFNTKNKSTITVSDFKSDYWPILFNDLVAARNFLDVENDAQRCNTETVVVIAAQESASMAMGWCVYECERRVVGGGASALLTGGTMKYPSDDLAACVWLGPVRQAAAPVTMTFRPAQWFAKPSASRLREATPMYFLYGKQDRNSATEALTYFNALKRPPEGKSAKSHNFDKEEGLATSLPGQDLLGGTLGVDEKIVTYLKAVLEKHGTKTWKRQDPGPLQLFPIVTYGYKSLQ
ncbi:MAG: alpha/beta hydrolase [Gemmataceae bacterium]